jgi:ferric-dicitrate binding protein FerR (iron transport regulator)
MKTIPSMEDNDWARLAKSIYEVNPQNTVENLAPVADEVFTDKREVEQIQKIARQVDLYFDLKKYPVDEAWEKVESQIHQSSSRKKSIIRKFIVHPLYRYAAAIIVAALFLVSGYEVITNYRASHELLEISAARQVLNKFTLPDGTLVSLNSDTKISYPRKFDRKTREVNITGEAFFEVKPNKNQPFIIHAGKAQIKVVGTSFNVSAYPDKKLVEVIVETGKVQVQSKMADSIKIETLILTPGDKGTLAYSGNTLNKTTNIDPNFIAWKTHNLSFKATSLKEVIENLENVYKVNIRLDDPRLNGLLLTAQFNNYSLDFILKVIETTFKIEVKEVDGQYILKSNALF